MVYFWILFYFSPNEKRKEKRQKLKERKEQEKQKKEEVINQLKKLKREEIIDKLKEIQKITGNKSKKSFAVFFWNILNVGLKVLDIEDLEGDWDPEDYDRKMKEVFNDEFYEGEEDEKPDVSDLLGTTNEEEEYDYENIIEDEEETGETEANKEEEVEGEATGKKKKIRSAFKRAREIAKSKQELNSILEEYYKLNYEDLVTQRISHIFFLSIYVWVKRLLERFQHDLSTLMLIKKILDSQWKKF